MKTKDMKHIEFRALEWFDKVNGNSYFSCEIFVNDKLVHTTPMQYGYGTHYETVALTWLKDNMFSKQLLKKVGDSLTSWSIFKNIIGCRFTSTVAPSLKRDLHK